MGFIYGAFIYVVYFVLVLPCILTLIKSSLCFMSPALSTFISAYTLIDSKHKKKHVTSTLKTCLYFFQFILEENSMYMSQ